MWKFSHFCRAEPDCSTTPSSSQFINVFLTFGGVFLQLGQLEAV